MFKFTLRTVAAGLALGLATFTHANSIGFDSSTYSHESFIVVSLNYDFTEFGMVGGSVNIEWDSNVLVFLGFTRAPFQPDVNSSASPNGSFVSPGLYQGVGLGQLSPFFTGITSSGEIGTFTFRINHFGTPQATSCGFTLCVLSNDINPLLNFPEYENVSDEVIGNGISGANLVVPVPAAVWLLFSALLGLVGFGRKTGSN